jgi:hypothetical protein
MKAKHTRKTQRTCRLCAAVQTEGKESCPAVSAQGFECTRPKGHDGFHAACGTEQDSHPLDAWDNVDNAPEVEPYELRRPQVSGNLLNWRTAGEVMPEVMKAILEGRNL